jgi:hypothetical protein
VGRAGHGPAAAVRLRLLVDEALSADAVQAATNAQRALLQVNVRPSQGEGLRLPQSHGQRDGPSSGVAVCLSAAITLRASVALSGSAVFGRLTAGGSTRVATFRATFPRCEATRSARESTR